MNRVVSKLGAVACALFLGGGNARAEEKPAKPPAELQGVWKLTALEIKGKELEPVGGGSPRWVIKDNTISYGGEEIAQFTSDPATTPRVLDLKYRDPERTYEGIYTVEKDTLKVCLNKKADGTKDRPSKFATADQDDWVLLVFEREKAAPAKPTEGLTGYVGIAIRAAEDTKTPTVDAPIKGSPAEKGGLKKGDAILKVGTTDATDLETVVKAVRAAKPGDKLEFRVTRDGKEQTVTVTVGVFPFHWAAGLGS